MIDVVGGEKSSRVSVLFGYAVGLPAIHLLPVTLLGQFDVRRRTPVQETKLKFIVDPGGGVRMRFGLEFGSYPADWILPRYVSRFPCGRRLPMRTSSRRCSSRNIISPARMRRSYSRFLYGLTSPRRYRECTSAPHLSSAAASPGDGRRIYLDVG